MKKKLQKSLIMIILVLSMLALAACSKSDDDEEEEGGRRRRTENVDPTDEPTAEPTNEPTSEPAPTTEPADTPVPTAPAVTPDLKEDDNNGTGSVTIPGDDPVITDEPEITGKPEPTDEPVYTDSNILEVKYKSFDGVDESAKSVAAEFGSGFLTGNKEAILNTLAYDDDKMETLDQELNEFAGLIGEVDDEIRALGLDPATVDISSLYYLEPIGGKTFDAEEVASWMQLSDTYVDDITEWDNFCVISTEMKGSLASLLGYEGMDEGVNFVLAKRDGEYKVITATFYDDYSDEPVDPETNNEKLIEIKGKLYQFNGGETADEIIDLFNKSFEDFDFYTMLSCIAVDEDMLIDAIADNSEALDTFELAKSIPGMMSIKTERGEAVPVTEEELNDIRLECETVEHTELITDVVKYEVAYSMEYAGQSQTETETVYVGKYDGEYRIVKCFIFG